jgi:hypothetical protein
MSRSGEICPRRLAMRWTVLMAMTRAMGFGKDAMRETADAYLCSPPAISETVKPY